MSRVHYCPCGHRTPTRPKTNGVPKMPLTLTELMQPARLVHLMARRPDVADLGLPGAVVAAAVRWSA